MNEEQREYWDGIGGRRWTQHQLVLDRALAAYGAAILDAAAVRGGENVLDVGCGCGDSSIGLVERVGPEGSVLGIDLSKQMLDRARERAGARPNLRFRLADASSVELPAEFDLVLSRFGVMFFEDPAASFSNLRKALRPNGRLAFICWRPFGENRWNTLATAAVRAVLPEAVNVTDPEAPGPYSFGDDGRVRRILTQAGFQSIAIDRFDADVVLSSSDLDSAVEFSLNIGPASRLLIGVDPDVVERVRRELRRVLAPHRTERGVALGGSAWIVRAAR